MTNDMERAPIFNWENGRITWFDGPTSAAKVWSCIVCGDWAPSIDFRAPGTRSAEALYHDVLPILQSTNINLVNVEAVFALAGLTPIVKDGVTMQIDPHWMPALQSVPFHLGCLANNHIFDYGVEGLRHTRTLLIQVGMQVIGAGETAAQAEQPAWLDINGTRVAVVNVAEGEEARSSQGMAGAAAFDLPRVCLQVAELRQRADVVMVVAHAGREHLPAPAPYIRRAYHALVEAGANIVVGHHPHVAQGIEWYAQGLIVYSLGNFVLWMGTTVKNHYRGFCLKLNFQGSGLASAEVVPYRISDTGLWLLKDAERPAFFEHLRQLSVLAADSERLEDIWDAYADAWLSEVGLDEWLDLIGALGGATDLWRALGRYSLSQFGEQKLEQRLVRRLLMAGLNPLEKRRQNSRAKLFAGTPSGETRRMAAVLRNRFDTPAHRELYLHALQRVMTGAVGTAPAWARQWLKEQAVFG